MAKRKSITLKLTQAEIDYAYSMFTGTIEGAELIPAAKELPIYGIALAFVKASKPLIDDKTLDETERQANVIKDNPDFFIEKIDGVSEIAKEMLPKFQPKKDASVN